MGAKMIRAKLLEALRRLSVETGSLACAGCGYEHSCATKGCAILRAARREILDGVAKNELLQHRCDALGARLEEEQDEVRRLHEALDTGAPQGEALWVEEEQRSGADARRLRRAERSGVCDDEEGRY